MALRVKLKLGRDVQEFVSMVGGCCICPVNSCVYVCLFVYDILNLFVMIFKLTIYGTQSQVKVR